MLQLLAHAMNEGVMAEEPMQLIINAIDQNDNVPEFIMNPFFGNVSESADIGAPKKTLLPNMWMSNALQYILLANLVLFSSTDATNPVSGIISLKEGGLDREVM